MNTIPDTWDTLIHRFHKIQNIDFYAKGEYEQLRKEVFLSKDLTERQMSGLIGRIDYQLDLIENPLQEPKDKKQDMANLTKARTKK